jgi:hypothetical protein
MWSWRFPLFFVELRFVTDYVELSLEKCLALSSCIVVRYQGAQENWFLLYPDFARFTLPVSYSFSSL